MKQALTLILPCYNSENFIGQSFSALENFIAGREHITLFFIDDCSSDNTHAILVSLQKNSPHSGRIKIFKNEINLGKGGTLKQGIDAATTALLAFTDPDLAYDLENLDNFYKNISPAKILIANRVHPDSRYIVPPAFFRYIFTRHLSSRFFNFISRNLLISKLEDSQAGLKMFYADEIKPLMKLSRKSGFSFDLEMLCIAHCSNIEIVQMPVKFRYDHETTTISFLSDSVKILLDLLHLYIRKISGKYTFHK